ncbi:MAG: hypothetical protein WD070_12410 [Pirellulaceae bacterium]
MPYNKLKAKAFGAGADAKLELNEQIMASKGEHEDGESKLAGTAHD